MSPENSGRTHGRAWLVPAALAAIVVAPALVTAPSAQAAAKLGQRPLKLGMQGADVRALQKSLSRLKLRTPAHGRFGRSTRRSQVALERRLGWRPVNGRVSRLEAKRIRGKVNAQRARKFERQRSAAGGYVFPVPEAHDYGGAQARFGAGRSGHSHQGQDLFAACGARLLSAQAGRITTKAYQGSGAGFYLVVRGIDGQDFVYMHMQKASWAKQGQRLYAGQQIGRVGDSGNASGCHLHFEIWKSPGWYAGGKPIDPYPLLKQWDSYS